MLVKEQEEQQHRPSPARSLFGWFRGARSRTDGQPVLAAQPVSEVRAIAEVQPTIEGRPTIEVQPTVEDQPTAVAEPIAETEPVKVALGAVFEAVKPAEQKLQQFAAIQATLGQLDGLAIVASLESIRAFQENVHGAYVPLLGFDDHLAKVAENFEPMKLIHSQLRGLHSALASKIAELTNAMRPVKEIRTQLGELSQAFESADDLYDRLIQLSEKLGAGLSAAKA